MQNHAISSEKSDNRYLVNLRSVFDADVLALTAPEKQADSDYVLRLRITYLEQVTASAMTELADLRLQRPRRNLSLIHI